MLALLTKRTARKGPQDLMGIDFGTSGAKAVRIRKGPEGYSLVGADIFPPYRFDQEQTADGIKSFRANIPKTLLTNYTAIAYSSEKSVVRVVSLPGNEDSPIEREKQIRDNVGLDDQFRVNFIPTPGKAKETRLLAVAIPNSDAAGVLELFSSGPPAVNSLEVAGLAALNACVKGPLSSHPNEAVAVLECGSRFSMLSIFNKGNLSLARKIEVGGDAVLAHIQKQLGVDYNMASSILSQGAIDVSQSVRHVVEPFLRQLSISRDFVERQENCRVSVAYISGGMALSPAWLQEVQSASGMELRAWDPFGGMAILPDAIPENLAGQQSRFAAAVGTVLGVLDET